MEQMTKNGTDRVIDEDTEERLYFRTTDDDADSKTYEDYEDERKEEVGREEEDAYEIDDSFTSDGKSREDEREKVGYEETSLEDEKTEEERDVPADDIATISATEKPEEEVRQDAVEPDHVFVEIPAEIIPSREALLEKINKLLTEQTELRRKNRYLQKWILKHMRKMQEKVVAADTIEESEQMDQIYRRTLYTYKQHLDDVTERKTRITFDMESYEDRAQKTADENARVFDELLERERELARGKGLVYAKTGRMLTEKAVNEITRRQVSRREALARDRYEYILLQHRLEDANVQLQNLETLGTGMSTTDYENLHAAHVSYKDKLDERDRELEKLRHKIGEMVNGIAHYKEKGTCLAEDIKFEERELNEYHEQTANVREDVNKLHLTLRDLRRARDEKRLEGGLLMAPLVLRETERLIKMLAAVRYDIEIIKREIHRHDPANGKKRSNEVSGNVNDDSG